MEERSLIAASRFLRGLGAGALSIVFATTLAQSGEPRWLVGILVGLALGGASLWTLSAPSLERRIGRRLTLYLCAGLLSGGGVLLWLGSELPWVVGVAALMGGLVVGGSDVGPTAALEQAALGGVSTPQARTLNFSIYNVVGYLGGAFGALLAAPLLTYGPRTGWLPPSTGNGDLLLYALVGLALLPLYASLRAPALHTGGPRGGAFLTREHRKNVLSLSALFSVDAFGGGLIANTLVAWWLEFVYGASPAQVGLILFTSTLAAGGSLLLATPLSRKLGLIRTMVFTHIPSSLLLVLFPFSPNLVLAALLWVGRSMISQVDVPTRQSFTQAIVDPVERGAAAGYTTAARSTSALGAPLTGGIWSLGGPWLSIPFVLGGTVKIAYDLVLYGAFRQVLPPEEQALRKR